MALNAELIQNREDAAIAGALLERLMRGQDLPEVGTEVHGIDVRLGMEGPGSWTRIENATVQEKHIRAAQAASVALLAAGGNRTASKQRSVELAIYSELRRR